jgi:hypothetical protein
LPIVDDERRAGVECEVRTRQMAERYPFFDQLLDQARARDLVTGEP